MKKTSIKLDFQYSNSNTPISVLTSILDFIYLFKVVTIWQTNGTVYRLKPRLF